MTAGSICAAQTDFETAVTATKPVAFFRLDATSGKSEIGAAGFRAQGGVSAVPEGSPTGASAYAKFDGQNGWVLTTQKGGVATAASIMSWVNLADLPSKAGRIFYVAGESESGNDLDLQFETDDVLRFFTAAGGQVEYKAPAGSLVNQWHMIVATLDTTTKARAIYWDGKLVAKDANGGRPNKTAAFSIGASTVWGDRWFKGGIQDAALWNRAVRATEVAAIYAAASGGNGGSGAAAANAEPAAPTTGPFATTAKVEASDANGAIQLRREEQIAFMFLSAMETIEHNCQLNLHRACSMAEVMGGAGGEHLKFDPNKSDPNYSYTLAAGGMAWEAHANAKKPGLMGLCFMSRNVGTTVTTYGRAGKSGWVDTEILNRGVEGDLFDTQ